MVGFCRAEKLCVGGEAVSLSRKVFTTRIWRTRTTWIGSRCYMLPLRTTLAGVLHVGWNLEG
jgi:hypothetical protein